MSMKPVSVSIQRRADIRPETGVHPRLTEKNRIIKIEETKDFLFIKGEKFKKNLNKSFLTELETIGYESVLNETQSLLHIINKLDSLDLTKSVV